MPTALTGWGLPKGPLGVLFFAVVNRKPGISPILCHTKCSWQVSSDPLTHPPPARSLSQGSGGETHLWNTQIKPFKSRWGKSETATAALICRWLPGGVSGAGTAQGWAPQGKELQKGAYCWGLASAQNFIEIEIEATCQQGEGLQGGGIRRLQTS